MSVRIVIDLPDGRSVDLEENPPTYRGDRYRQDARDQLDRQYATAVRWLDDQSKPGGSL